MSPYLHSRLLFLSPIVACRHAQQILVRRETQGRMPSDLENRSTHQNRSAMVIGINRKVINLSAIRHPSVPEGDAGSHAERFRKKVTAHRRRTTPPPPSPTDDPSFTDECPFEDQ